MTTPVKPDFCNWATACLIVRDIQKALDFYTSVFGFTTHFLLEDTKTDRLVFARITYKNSNICLYLQDAFGPDEDMGLAPASSDTKTPVRLYVYCDDLQARYQKALDYGLTILMPITLKFWGDNIFRVLDPEGYIWEFATIGAERDSKRFKGTFF